MNHSFKETVLLIALAAVALWLVLHAATLYSLLQVFLSSLHPLFLGGLLAFILNVPMKKIEHQLDKLAFLRPLKRSLAIVGVLLVVVVLAVALLGIVLPTLVESITKLVFVSRTALPGLVGELQGFLQAHGLLTGQIGEQLTGFLGHLRDISLLSSLATTLLGGLVANVSGLFSNTLSWVMAAFLALALLASKEDLQRMSHKLLSALFPMKMVDRIAYIGQVVVSTYERFLLGQMMEACIIGSLVCVTYTVFGLPYAGMAGILSGVLSFIPYIGPLAACLISALFVAVQDPFLGLWAIVLFQILQLIEGNVIYPRVVGQSVGLPPLFTLVAALIGGNLFGLLGMIFFTPLFAVLYRLIREWVTARLPQHPDN